jgi:cytoskeletal protein RodZ
MPTIGEKLEETRLRRGLTVEDVAHKTRIHPNMLIRIEEDDFSQFPSVAYAKSFIRKYSEHLGVDLGDAMETLNGGVMRLGENELMGEMKKTIHKDRRFRLERTPRAFRRRSDKPAGAPLFLNLVLGTLIVSLGLFYFLGYNAPSAQKAKEEIARGLGIELPPATTPETPASAPRTLPDSPAATDAGSSAAAPDSPGNVTADPTIPRDDPAGRQAPPAPGETPVYPPIKPAVEISFDDALKPRPAAPSPATGGAAAPGLTGSAAMPGPATPRPRETPGLVISENPVAPPQAARAVPSGPSRAEPQPALLPEGTLPPGPAPIRAQPVPPAP